MTEDLDMKGDDYNIALFIFVCLSNPLVIDEVLLLAKAVTMKVEGVQRLTFPTSSFPTSSSKFLATSSSKGWHLRHGNQKRTRTAHTILS